MSDRPVWPAPDDDASFFRRLRDWLASDRRRGHWLAALVALTAAAAYLGVAVGDSLESGGAAGLLPSLPTRSPGVREIACGASPISLDQGDRATLAFDTADLPGFKLAGVNVEPVSASASLQAVDVEALEGAKVLFVALQVGGEPGRRDEYRLIVLFGRDEERVLSQCTVFVVAPPASPTPTPTATRPAPTLPPATPTPAPVVETRTPEPTPIVTGTPAPTSTSSPTPEGTGTPEPTSTPAPTPALTPEASPTQGL